MPTIDRLLLIALLAAGSNTVARAQDPPNRAMPQPAPAASAESHPDFTGTWSLDYNLSADLTRVDFGAGEAQSGEQGGRFGGFGGGRRGGRGGFGGSAPADASTRLEKSRLQDLTNELKRGYSALVISHHDPSFVVNDAANFTQFFQTNGSHDEQPFGSGPIGSTTRWEGPRLVTEYAISSRQKLVCTYTVLPSTKQLVLRVRFDAAAGGRRGSPGEVKLVYTLGQSTSK